MSRRGDNKARAKMLRDVEQAFGAMPAGAIVPTWEYEVRQRLKDLWRRSRKYAMRPTARKGRSRR